jgi:hypothetical protein
MESGWIAPFFLTLTLRQSEWSVSSLCLLTNLTRSWVDLRVGLDAVEKRKICLWIRAPISRPSSPQYLLNYPGFCTAICLIIVSPSYDAYLPDNVTILSLEHTLKVVGLCGDTKCTNSMEVILSWEANSRQPTQEFTNVSWNPKVHYCAHKSLLVVRTLNQMNQIHYTQSYFFKIDINIIFQPTSRPT